MERRRKKRFVGIPFPNLLFLFFESFANGIPLHQASNVLQPAKKETKTKAAKALAASSSSKAKKKVGI